MDNSQAYTNLVIIRITQFLVVLESSESPWATMLCELDASEPSLNWLLFKSKVLRCSRNLRNVT